jgi:putative nucleotidyltransferase with HDIG domain
VAKLAEPAAIAVGVNYFLVRAGAYYHDIGKMIKPKYYSENQTTPEDKKIYHNITPNMAVLIIKQHIKEGMELARKAGLPQAILDFIPQHHGTSLIRFFYNQALKCHQEGKSDDIIREEDFRYPGPKPQTIETAIVMLADCVEATITSELSQAFLDQDSIRLIIEESFVQTLLSRYHYRVEYPGKRKSVELQEIKQEMGNSKEYGS